MYKMEMHLHTVGNSTCGLEHAEAILEAYKAAGYNGIVMTNHFNQHIYYNYFKDIVGDEAKVDFFLREFLKLKELGEKENMDILFGLEIALKGDSYDDHLQKKCIELLVYGITVEQFRENNIAMCDMTYPDFFDYCTKMGWLVIQAHPYRARTARVSPKYLHGIEVFNGNPAHLDKNTLAAMRAKKYNLLYTAGSDFHFVGAEGTAMLFPTRCKTEAELVKAISARNAQLIKVKSLGLRPSSK